LDATDELALRQVDIRFSDGGVAISGNLNQCPDYLHLKEFRHTARHLTSNTHRHREFYCGLEPTG